MADRNLTYEEFRILSEKEKCGAYQKLSDEDKLRVRVCTPTERSKEVPCNKCIHRIKNTPNCKAYPQGILIQQMRRVMNEQSQECGDGYHFEREVDV